MNTIEPARLKAIYEALAPVNFGMTRNGDFVAQMKNSANHTPLQRWWLVKLVVRHRRQMKAQHASTLAWCERWLQANAEPVHNPPAPPPTQEPPAPPRKESAADPTLF